MPAPGGASPDAGQALGQGAPSSPSSESSGSGGTSSSDGEAAVPPQMDSDTQAAIEACSQYAPSGGPGGGPPSGTPPAGAPPAGGPPGQAPSS